MLIRATRPRFFLLNYRIEYKQLPTCLPATVTDTFSPGMALTNKAPFQHLAPTIETRAKITSPLTNMAFQSVSAKKRLEFFALIFFSSLLHTCAVSDS